MKIILEDSGKTLKVIELNTLQMKALRLVSPQPIDYVFNRVQRILDSAIQTAKQLFAEYRLKNATDSELKAFADEIASKEKEMP